MQIVHSGDELAYLLDANGPGDQIGDDFSPQAWIKDPQHLALRIGNDLAMFEHKGDGEWLGHIWYNSRGQRALDRARIMLNAMFARYSAKVINGEVPATRKDVAAFVRRLGFEPTGTAVRPQGRVKLFTLTI